MNHMRKCIGCNSLKPRDELIKITRKADTSDIYVNPDSKIFGRSVYLCYNKSCKEKVLKNNKVEKMLKVPFSEELKGKLIELS